MTVQDRLAPEGTTEARRPSGGPLTGVTVAIVTTVVTFATAVLSAAAEPDSPYDADARNHWSLRPRAVSLPPCPSTDGARNWCRTPVDAFLWEQLARHDLAPAPEAAPATLVRRLHFDLLGLPPAPELVEEFESEKSPDAWERLVDRLLASPRLGERQAQHWLDVVRFAETEGFEYDQHRPGAWRFRDYVIQSANADVPFNQFAREQLAGDELSNASPAALIASGFHRLGPVRRNAGNSDVAFSRQEVLTEMTDAVGTVFLGLTLGCARCHDHKFDPIQQVDYYRLQAFFASTHEHDESLAEPAVTQRWQDETRRIKEEMQRLRERMQQAEGQQREQLVAQLGQLEATLPAPLPALSGVRVAADERASVAVLERGQTDKPRQQVGPRPLGVLISANQAEWSPALQRPKSQLADWLLAPEHPLTSRVLVNRLWQAHFGTGIVATPNDFGLNGAPPSHPALLDYLANRLVVEEWRRKPLQRLLVTSAGYRQASLRAVPDDVRRRDPENRWLSHFPRRRLDAEQLRDTLLTLAGLLDLRMGGESIMLPVDEDLVKLLYKPSQWQVATEAADHHRRSIYLLAKRNLRLPGLEVFDQPDLAISCGRRESSTHAPQALELLNGEFANRMAEQFARRLERDGGGDRDRQIGVAFHLLVAREPTADERRLCRDFLRHGTTREWALALLNLHVGQYVE
ncbi:MAG: DUF1553 domain-containing protein [Pirellulales bacterium]